jgi:hypothetical protein
VNRWCIVLLRTPDVCHLIWHTQRLSHLFVHLVFVVLFRTLDVCTKGSKIEAVICVYICIYTSVATCRHVYTFRFNIQQLHNRAALPAQSLETLEDCLTTHKQWRLLPSQQQRRRRQRQRSRSPYRDRERRERVRERDRGDRERERERVRVSERERERRERERERERER